MQASELVMAGLLGLCAEALVSVPCRKCEEGGLATGIMPEELNGRTCLVLPGCQAALAISFSVSSDIEPWVSS